MKTKMLKRLVALVLAVAIFSAMGASAMAYYTAPSTAPSVSKPWYGYCTSSNGIYVRASVGVDGTAVSSVAKNSYVHIIEKTHVENNSDDEWFGIYYNFSKSLGYVSAAYINNNNTRSYVKVSDSSAVMRTGSGTSYSSITTVPKGTSLPCTGYVITSSGQNWYSVIFATTQGYMYSNVLDVG